MSIIFLERFDFSLEWHRLRILNDTHFIFVQSMLKKK